jgi:hypothetical protein
MKITSFRPWLFALILGIAVNASANSTELLRQAYHELASADHDYKGHRASAMRQLDEAGKVLGASLHGDTKEHEKQGISDDHLKIAQNLLQEAANGLPRKALKHVLAAEKDISTALNIK